jgi:hypothetical protein
MRKIITGFNARRDQTRSALQSWALHEFGPSVAVRRGVCKLTLNLSDDPPVFLPPPPANAAAPAAYDVVMMMWLDDDVAAFSDPSLVAHAGRVHSYVVEEIPEKPEVAISQGRATPGIKNLPLIICQDRHDDSARRERWRVHAELARRIHTGMSSYVRNVVVQVLDSDAPAVHGIGEVGFATLEDLQFGLFPKPEDRQEFLDDIGGWVKASTAQYAAEHVLKW